MVLAQTLNVAEPISRIDLQIRSDQPTVSLLAVRATTSGRALRSVTRRIAAGDGVYQFRFPTVFPTIDRPVEFALTLPDQPAGNRVSVAAYSRDVFPSGRAYVPGFLVDSGVDLQFLTFQEISFWGVLGEIRGAFERTVVPAPAAVVAIGAALVLIVVTLGVAAGVRCGTPVSAGRMSRRFHGRCCC